MLINFFLVWMVESQMESKEVCGRFMESQRWRARRCVEGSWSLRGGEQEAKIR
jgi:hypothetical protein